MTCQGLKLIDAWLDDDLSAEDAAALEHWLRADQANLETFARAGILHRRLRDTLRAQATTDEAVDSVFGIQDYQIPNQQIPSPPFALHPSYPFLSPLPSPLSPLAVGGPVFSYIAATLILGVMLLSAWAYKITHNYGDSFVANSRRSTTSGGTVIQPSEFVVVGRVTGMKDCRWADPATEAYLGAAVPLGRKYVLASGLLEITYRSGARAILEGPCSYEVESFAGGFLALGKLTARVDKNSEFGIRNSEKRMQANSQFPIPNSELYSVRTPTAVVTDLGTEFGVEVAVNGDTTSHVFQGSIQVRATEGPAASAAGGAGAKSQIPNPKSQIILAAGESARVEKDAETGDARITTGAKVGAPPKFVRRLYEPPKLLDLLDIVAGGNGTGCRRGRGIDQTTGGRRSALASDWRYGDWLYGRVSWHGMIDGVFVPDDRDPPVEIDSAGHTFAEFPRSLGATFGLIWARAAEVAPAERGTGWIFEIVDARQFTPDGRGLLAFHACAGITFDLAAVRKRFPDVYPARFQAVVGLGDPRPFSASADGNADFLVFVDGQLKLNRTGLRQQDGAVKVAVELGPEDRFLTLVSTDGGNSIRDDCVVVGDPVLHMAAGETTDRKEGRDKQP